MNFAVGQRATCRLQIFSLPSANKKFADGKCAAGHRQNSLRINGKIKFSNRQIPYITSCRSTVKHLFQAGSFKTIPKLRQAPPKKTNYREYQRKKASRAHAINTPRRPASKTPCACHRRRSPQGSAKKLSRMQNAAANPQCWKRGRGLGRERNNASEEEVSLPPQKTNYRE